MSYKGQALIRFYLRYWNKTEWYYTIQSLLNETEIVYYDTVDVPWLEQGY